MAREIQGPNIPDVVEPASRPGGASLSSEITTQLPRVPKKEGIILPFSTPARGAHVKVGLPPVDSAPAAPESPSLGADDRLDGTANTDRVEEYIKIHGGASLSTISKETGLPLSAAISATTWLTENGKMREVPGRRSATTSSPSTRFELVDEEKQRMKLHVDRIVGIMGEKGTPLSLRQLGNDIAVDITELRAAMNKLFEEGRVEAVASRYYPGTGKKEMIYALIPPEAQRENTRRDTVVSFIDRKRGRTAKDN